MFPSKVSKLNTSDLETELRFELLSEQGMDKDRGRVGEACEDITRDVKGHAEQDLVAASRQAGFSSATDRQAFNAQLHDKAR